MTFRWGSAWHRLKQPSRVYPVTTRLPCRPSLPLKNNIMSSLPCGVNQPYTARYETGISKALGMQPSAPVLGIPPGSQSGGTGCGPGFDDRAVNAPSVAPGDRLDQLSAYGAAAARPGHLLTRLSLHGQGVRRIEGLEACPNLKVLVRGFSHGNLAATGLAVVGRSCIVRLFRRWMASMSLYLATQIQKTVPLCRQIACRFVSPMS